MTGGDLKWRCWIPDYHTRDDASDIVADNEKDAACAYARLRFTSSDPFSELTVRVAAWGSGRSSEVDVDVHVEPVPEFWADKPRPVPTTEQ